jgi:hypothetical protein
MSRTKFVREATCLFGIALSLTSARFASVNLLSLKASVTKSSRIPILISF